MEAQPREKNKVSALVNEVATRILRAGAEQVESEIEHGLLRLGQHLGASRAYVCRRPEQGNSWRNTLEWRSRASDFSVL